MKRKVYNGGEWTFAKWKNFLISSLRAAMRRWPPKWKALNNAKVGKQPNKHTGRMAEHYSCASCGGVFIAKEVQVDHINPVVDPDYGFIDWETYLDRMFCEEENLQVLCKGCHKVKTNEERKQRKKVKDAE